MQAFLEFAVRSRLNAIVAATGLAMLSVVLTLMVLVFPPLFLLGVVAYFMSGAVVALAALKFGLSEGLVVMLGPAIFWTLPMLAGGEGEVPGALLAVPAVSAICGVFLPLLVMASMLKNSGSQALAFATGAGLVALVVFGFHFTGFDPSRWLFAEMLPMLQSNMPDVNWQEGGAPGAGAEPPGTQSALALGVFAANTLVVLILCLVMARWWHARLDNPGGFGREFRALRFGPRVAYLTVVLAGLALAFDGWVGELALKLVPIVMVLGMFQGLAVAHGIAKGQSAGRQWLIGLYVLLVVPVFNTMMVLLMVVVGLIDYWIGFRERWARS